MENTINSLNVAIHNGRDVVKTGETNIICFIGIFIEAAYTDATTSLHRGPCSCRTIKVNLQVFLTREVETRNIITQ